WESRGGTRSPSALLIMVRLRHAKLNIVLCAFGRRGRSRAGKPGLPSIAANDVVVEIGVTDHTLKQPHPQRHHHFGAAGGGDVAKIDDLARLPAEPLSEISSHILFGHGIVAANEQVMIARDA